MHMRVCHIQRSSFDAVNQLDFIPMDSFEVCGGQGGFNQTWQGGAMLLGGLVAGRRRETSSMCACLVHLQAKFWKLRQSELEGYSLLYAPLKPRQGDLTGEPERQHWGQHRR